MAHLLFDKKRYYTLSTNDNLSDAQEDEILSYQVILENQIYYTQRNLYISFIEKYLRENADTLCLSMIFLFYFGKL